VEIDGRERMDQAVLHSDGPVIDFLMELAAVDAGLLLRQTVAAILRKDRGWGRPPLPLLDALASWSGDPAAPEYQVFAHYIGTDCAIERETSRIARQRDGTPTAGRELARQVAWRLSCHLPDAQLSDALEEAAADLPRLREFLRRWDE